MCFTLMSDRLGSCIDMFNIWTAAAYTYQQGINLNGESPLSVVKTQPLFRTNP